MDGDTRGRGARVMDGLGRPPRRLLVLGGGAAALALLADHGLRLDLPRPPAPAPTRRPAPDEKLLLGAVAELDRVVRAEGEVLAASADDALVRRVRTVSRDQLRVLRGRLTNSGVPTSVIEGAVAATRASSPVRTRSALASLLAEPAAGQWSALTTATEGARALLAAAYSERLAAAVLLGHPVDTVTAPSPARPAVVARTQPLVYAFEVVAAQSSGSQRRRAEETLAELSRLDLAVSGTGSTTPPGWALPFPVTTAADARRLATEVLRSAVDGAVAAAGAVPTARSLEDVARWSANVQALAVDWDIPLTAFPGASA
ncbi:hypothetical protein [Terrabacter terrigena]|uniref:DUF4439 domain-containing protein n=1 Tax=Terrabacter terrigena TaxID=574718 RepID=A0ABW3MTP0_9MICO